MRIDLTVRTDGVDHDVAVTTARPASMGDLRPALARTVGLPVDRPVWNDEHLVPDTAVLGRRGLRSGAVVVAGGPRRAGAPPGVLALHRTGGPGAGQVIALGRDRLVVGRGTECDVVLADGDVSRRHATLEAGPDGAVLRDLGSTNGTWLDDARLDHRPRTVRPGQVIRIGHCSLEVTGPVGVPAALSDGPDGTIRLSRPPRRDVGVPADTVELPTRPDARAPRSVQWIAALLPAAAGVGLAWFTHSPQFLVFMLLSPIMMISASMGDRLHWRRSHRRAAAEFTDRAGQAARLVRSGLRAETAARRARSPDPAVLWRTVTLPSSGVWERRPADPDHLVVRVGITDAPSVLQVRDAGRTRPAGTVRSVPAEIALRTGPLGVTGPREVCAGLGRWLVAQLAALHSPADVSLSLLLGAVDTQSWRCLRWLPHVGGRAACVDAARAALVSDLVDLVEGRTAATRRRDGPWAGPWHVVVVDAAAELAALPGLVSVLERGPAVGVTAVCLAPTAEALPAACRTVVRPLDDTGLRVQVCGPPRVAFPGYDSTPEMTTDDTDVLVDTVSVEWADDLARHLAPLVDAGADGDTRLPTACGLLDALGLEPDSDVDPTTVARRWDAGGGAAVTVLGRGPEGPLRLDLAADGPHLLVAGTTGAGKSELLQTLVAGLAAHHSPAELNVLLVDYKGGAAFADCARLPHTAGLVTDLDQQLTERALRSLHAELRRREERLAEAGAIDLAAYRSLCRDDPHRTGVARLVIVVDEFATLAEELPDFLRGLIAVAQRGRSLGVHLVLATQRPSSAVSPEIRANTALRIALRVTDAADSVDVVDAADAAGIERTTPGRAVLRAGSTLTAFQTAFGGNPVRTDDGPKVTVLDGWRRPAGHGTEHGPTELTVLVDAIGKAAAERGLDPAAALWAAPLPERLSRTDLAAPPGRATVAVGVVDRPDAQRRDTLHLDLDAGTSLLLAGAARSGRTGSLTAMVLAATDRLSPAELAVYVVDAAGASPGELAALPHCATHLGPAELTLVPTLLRRLADLRRDQRAAGPVPPRTLIMIDGWEALTAGLDDADAVECAELLAGLLRAGPAAAVTVVVGGDRSVLAPRFAAGFATRVLLRMPDRADYAAVGLAPREVPTTLSPGRGVLSADGALVQLAHAGRDPGPEGVVADVRELTNRWRGRLVEPAAGAVRLRPLPVAVSLDTLLSANDVAGAQPDASVWLGVGGDDARPVRAALFAGAGRMLVAGPPRSGRSTVLRGILRQARTLPLAVHVAAPARSPLHADGRRFGLDVIEPRTDLPADPPDGALLVLVDDCEAFADTAAGETLAGWLRRDRFDLAAVVAGRADDLATGYRGLGAEVRRAHTGLLLRPGPVDGDILGVRLPRRPAGGPAGRGVLVADPAWGDFTGQPMPIQVATP